MEVNHLYIITNPTNLPVLPIISDFKDNVTMVNQPNTRMEGSLTHEISKHFQSLKNLTQDQFDWLYYTHKYPDLSTINSKKAAWDHWKGPGLKECRNPLDCRTISQWEDVNRNVTLMAILINAETNRFKKIAILELTGEVYNVNNFEQLVKSHTSAIENKPLVIFSQSHHAYAYIIDSSLYPLFISELSMFISSFESIMEIYEGSFPNQSIVFDYPKNREPRQPPKSNLKFKPSHLVVDIAVVSKTVPQARFKYYQSVYELYLTQLKKPLLTSELLCLNQLMCKYSYDDIKYKYNAQISLNYQQYLHLLVSLITQNYWQSENDLKIVKKTADIDRYGCIVFSHDFYLTLYPCYRGVFKNATDSYNHFVSCGKKEKLIGNELIFKLIKVIQDDQRDHLLHLVMSNHLKNIEANKLLSPIFFDAHSRRYYSSDKPLFYILTRTCNRETLFAQCCESINNQTFVNVRHVVGYDNEDTKRYVRQYKHIYKTIDLIAKKNKIHPNQYIDAFYEQIEHSGPGWVLVLDDDDHFMTNLALTTLEPFTKNPNHLIIWMLYRPDKFIYPEDKNKPIVGEIASCCYLYHTSKLSKGKWGGNGIGDFFFFQHLFNQTQPKDVIYLDYPLTGVNYQTQISGWAAL